ncbi:hypothetical protein [uncultured Campylobacter sp.]|uniref:hypothetical protein n=1 Tax=uncultured Campylobacter sp. TaxID=218934 RepID=UPI00262BBCDC|nr:hypothetical protein [uncultured Campylobacter sp.]
MKSPAAEAAIRAAKFQSKISIFADKFMRLASKLKFQNFIEQNRGAKGAEFHR